MKALHFLERLVSFPSISSEPTNDMVSYLAELSEPLGFSVSLFPSSPKKSNIIAHIGPREDAIALSGHMDVVPIAGQDWSVDPFSLHIQENKAYGRGACDMKGFFACVYAALQEFPLHKLKKGISLVWTHDEEVGCRGAQQLCQTLQEKEISLPKSILIGEPTSMNIARMHGGHSTILIKIKGKPAHSSKPELGASAIIAAGQSIKEIQSIQTILAKKPCQHQELAGCHSLINIASIKGGTAVNIIPEHCEILLGIRPMPGRSLVDIQEQIIQKILPIQRGTQTVISLELLQEAPPMLTPLGTDLQKALQTVFPQANSIGLPFATDGGCFQGMGSHPIICGPGSINQAHKADEFISIPELKSYTNTLKTLLFNWCL